MPSIMAPNKSANSLEVSPAAPPVSPEVFDLSMPFTELAAGLDA
jgi:hypothetical protein